MNWIQTGQIDLWTLCTHLYVMQVFHWRPTLQLSLSIYKVGCKIRGVGDKNPQRRENFGSASTPRQDVIHTGLSGSRGRPAVGLGCFVQTGLEPTRTSPNRQAVAGPDKPYRLTGLKKQTDSP